MVADTVYLVIVGQINKATGSVRVPFFLFRFLLRYALIAAWK
jgi:hypothetical protein